MRFLIDTHVLLWALGYPERLSTEASALLEDAGGELLFSVASVWEVAIKHSQGRAYFQVPPHLFRETLLRNGYEELPVLGQHTVALDGLPPIHKDPFDRILVAQATVERVTLLTADPVIARYPGPIRKV